MAEYTLTLNARTLDRHPHRLTCIIAAFERGLVTVGNGIWALDRGARIVRMMEGKADG